MSNLQLSLAIAGVLLLVGVAAHGAWTTRRHQPRQAEQEGPQERESRRTEPSLDALGAAAPAAAAAADDDALLLPSATDKKSPLDPLIDIIATLELEHCVSGEAVLLHLPATRRIGSKPYGIEGLEATTGRWETPQPGRHYSALQAGVQMANRAGALNEIEYSEFVAKAQALADALGATPEFPDMLDAVGRGRELDAFANAHDAQLSLTLRARQTAWSVGYVRQHAARLGLVNEVLPGRMTLPATQPGQPPLLSLHYDAQAALADHPAHTAIRELRLTLEVAQIARAEQPYARLREVAAQVAAAMDGVITDDNGQSLSPAAMDQIGAELQAIYQQLEARELAAGSNLARRLFS